MNLSENIDDLIREHSSLWEEVNAAVREALKTGEREELLRYLQSVESRWKSWEARISRSGNDPGLVRKALPEVVRLRMTRHVLDKLYLSVSTGIKSGKVRFGIINGFVLNRLLFSHDLVRKPVSLFLFRLLWPFITQKRLLMPLVARKGIYCFYTSGLVSALARLIGDRTCLEVGAGDGSLASFLKGKGVNIIATDDFSWKGSIAFGEGVEKLDAVRALARYKPEVVLSSWPPPGNRFEARIFETESVRVYIVIGSRHAFASGNRQAYAGVKGFTREDSAELADLIIPRENENEVLIFRRG